MYVERLFVSTASMQHAFDPNPEHDMRAAPTSECVRMDYIICTSPRTQPTQQTLLYQKSHVIVLRMNRFFFSRLGRLFRSCFAFVIALLYETEHTSHSHLHM